MSPLGCVLPSSFPKDLSAKGGNCFQDPTVGLLLGEGSRVWVCSETKTLQWGKASNVNVEEVTFEVSFALTAAEAALPSPAPQPVPLSPLSLLLFLGMHRQVFQR